MQSRLYERVGNLSGFPMDRFTFCGILPADGRESVLRADNKIRHTLVYCGAPAFVEDTIAAMARIMPERRIAIVPEDGEVIIGYPCELLGLKKPDGEIAIVIEPAPEIKMSDEEINEMVRDVVKGACTRGDKK